MCKQHKHTTSQDCAESLSRCHSFARNVAAATDGARARIDWLRRAKRELVESKVFS